MSRLATRHVEVSAPPATDMQATAFPTGSIGTSGSGSVTFSCDPTADMHDGVTAAEGVSSYTWNIAGVDQTPITAGVSANIRTQPTLYQVGSYSPAPSVIQSGRDFTVTSAGAGFENTSDQLAMLGWEVTGDFDLYDYQDLFTGAGSQYAAAILGWREATAATVAATPGARMGGILKWLTNGSQGLQAKDRITTSGSPRFSLPTAFGTNTPRYRRVSRRTNTITYQYSTDGGAWTTLFSDTYTSLSSTLVIGAMLCDAQAVSVQLTARFSGLRYTAGAQSLITTPAYTTSTSVNAYVKCTDGAGNVSAVGPTVSASGASSAVMKFNPGFYAVVDNAVFLLDATRMSNIHAFITTIEANPYVTGILVKVRWASLEGATAGNCTAGFAAIDQIIAWLDACSTPKKLFINVISQTFQGPGSSSETSPQSWYPQYVINAGDVQTNSGSSPNTTLKLWTAGLVDRLNAFEALYGARYDNNTTFGGWMVEGETAISTMSPANFDAFHTQTKRRMTGTRAAFPKSELRIYFNFYRSGDCPDLMSHAVATRFGTGGPDPELPINTNGSLNTAAGNYRPIDGHQVFVGNINIGNYHDYPPGGPDMRGVLPSYFEIEGLGYAGIDGYNEPAEDIIAYAVNTLRATHIFMSTSDGPPYLSTQQWTSYVVPLINARLGVPGSITRPSSYT